MEDLEKDWSRVIWKQRNLEEMGEAKAMSDIEELYHFDDYMLQNWKPAHIGVTMADY